MTTQNRKRLLTKDPLAVYLYTDNLPFVEEQMKVKKQNRSEVLRELIDDGIRQRKIKNNGYDESAEHFTKYLTAAVNNALRPLRKQFDDLTRAVNESSNETNFKVNDLLTTTERVNHRTATISNKLEHLADTLAEVETTVGKNNSHASDNLLAELQAIKSLTELSVRNLIGIRVVVWLYLIEMLAPLVKSYADISKQQFSDAVKEHVMKLFTDEVLKELAFMKAGEVEEYIQREVVNLYQGIRKDKRIKVSG